MFGYLDNSQAPLSEWLTALAGRRRFLVFAAAGVVGALGHPPVGWPILTFFSLLFLFVAAPWRLGPRGAAWAGWAYGVGYFAVVLHWIVEPFLVDIARHGWMAPFAISLMAGGLALFYGAAFAVAGWRRSGLVLALTLSAAELGRAHLFGGFPWGMHVAAFVDVLFYQAAAWLGPFGLTLAFLLFFAFVARLQPYLGGALAAALGALTLVSVPPAEEAVEEGPLIRVVQPNARQDLKWLPDQAPIFLNRKLQATAAAPAADLVIWPETALTTWMQEADPIFAEAARVGQGAELLMGANSFVGGQAFNALAHVSDGALTATYEKAHLVPFGEYMPLRGLFERVGIFGLSELAQFGFHPGPGPAVLDVPGIGLVQPLICYESIFSYEVRRVAERPRLIAVVTNDAWFGELGGPAQHLAQSQARAIEMGLPVARSANTGISAIIDARGRIVASLPLGVAGHVDAPLPAALPPTLYARFGEWVFAILAILVLLVHLTGRRFDFD